VQVVLVNCTVFWVSAKPPGEQLAELNVSPMAEGEVDVLTAEHSLGADVKSHVVVVGYGDKKSHCWLHSFAQGGLRFWPW
jgi:hypothetical protein